MAIVDQLHGVFSARVRRVEFPQPVLCSTGWFNPFNKTTQHGVGTFRCIQAGNYNPCIKPAEETRQ